MTNKERLQQLVDEIMRENSYGIKGGKFSTDLYRIVSMISDLQLRMDMFDLIDDFLMEDYGYSALHYNDNKKIFYYKS
jgi:hypothetical protein